VTDLIQLQPEARRADYAAGRLKLVDRFGNEVGSHGDLAPEQRLWLTGGA
jgi:hypothetical protein